MAYKQRLLSPQGLGSLNGRRDRGARFGPVVTRGPIPEGAPTSHEVAPKEVGLRGCKGGGVLLN